MVEIDELISQLTLEEKAGLCSGLDFWHTKPVERLGVPSVMMCDGPNGLRKQTGEGDHLGINDSIETVCYPTASALAASFDRDVLRRLGTALGQECQAENIGMLLGPGVNMKRSPLCGRNFEYFSEDPYLAGELASAYIEALQAQGTAACVKHFACNNQETRRMSGSSQVDERTLHEIYLPAFEAAVKKGKARSVMCSYNAVNGTFSAENKELLTDILRRDWGFDGFVVTDWGAVKDRVKGLPAGLDLEMPGGPGTQDAKIVEAVKNGTLDEAVLDEAVRNILKFIAKCQASRRPDAKADRAAYSRLSGELETECAVLLKNDGILPIQGGSVAFIGEFAAKPRYQGAGSSHINVKHPVSALEAVGYSDTAAGSSPAPHPANAPITAASTDTSAVSDSSMRPANPSETATSAGTAASVSPMRPANASETVEKRSILYAQGYDVHSEANAAELLSQAVETAKKADTAVIFAGLPDSYETEGCDRETMKMPANQNALIEAVAAVNPNTVVVLHGGAPMELPWLSKVKAALCMYLGGEQVGAAAVRLLYGEANPSGKLAETWPLRLEDTPSYLNFPGEDGIVKYAEDIFIGYRYYDKKKLTVQFPFGYGLSYTQFAYSNLKLDKTAINDTDTLTIAFSVTNTGNMTGKEAVQLYVRDEVSTVRRPIRELKGFEKVKLAPSETKTVNFSLNKRAFAYYEPKIHNWFVESGRFIIEIGSSSRDIRLCGAVDVTGTAELPYHFTKNSAVADLSRTAKGRSLLQSITANRSSQDRPAAKKDVQNLGEGSEKMVQQMMQDMPLCALVTYGALSAEQLDGILTMLNN